MKSVMGIISLVQDDSRIKEFTAKRPIGAIPIASRYRLIDFSLSCLVNSGVDNVGIMLPTRARSLLDHVRSGKDWDLARKRKGLSYLPPIFEGERSRLGNIASAYDNIDFVKQSDEEYILLVGGNIVYNMDFSPVKNFLLESGADIVAVYTKARADKDEPGALFTVAQGSSVVTDIALRPSVKAGDSVGLGVYLMKKSVYVDLVATAYEHGGIDFLRDALMTMGDKYIAVGYEHTGYAVSVSSTMTYYRVSMEMLEPEVWEELFMGERTVYTKMRDKAPVEYKSTAEVSDTLAANGCIVRGKVDHSVLFRGVVVEEGAEVENCIVMQGAVIHAGARIANAILDKNVTITEDKRLSGAFNYPMIIGKGITI